MKMELKLIKEMLASHKNMQEQLNEVIDLIANIEKERFKKKPNKFKLRLCP